MKRATPLPWDWLPDEGQFIVDQHMDIVAETPCQGQGSKENGAYIARACNAYPRLIACVRSLIPETALEGSQQAQAAANAHALLRELGEAE